METTRTEAKTYEGWGIVEVMGHRTIAGRLSEVTVAGAPMLRVDVPGHGGRCIRCKGSGKSPYAYRRIEPCDACAGTGKATSEEPEFVATQFYASAALFSVTPTSEEVARAAAMESRPTPVALLPALPSAPVVAQEVPERGPEGSDEIQF